MCGITGYFCLDNTLRPDTFAAATRLIDYRGPDDFGYLTCSRNGQATEHHDEALSTFNNTEPMLGALGFRRLAIIDLSAAGHQPMADKRRNHWIVFNGEVYNYLEIRQELQQAGYQFQSNSDTEVVLTAYCHWGIACLDKFNGMWAMAILDIEKQQIFCARDRFGIKPFVFYHDDKKFAFGSESKQIQCLLDRQLDVDTATAFDFLIFGAKNHTQDTFYKDIKELRGGEYLLVDLAGNDRIQIKQERWWDLQASEFAGDEHEAAEEMLRLLKDSIHIRLRSDVATGTALSGGLDSNGVVPLIDELTDTQQDVFTVFSKDKDLDESVFAERSIKQYGLRSHKIEFGTQDIETLEKITFHHDQPLTNAGVFGGWILQQLIQSTNIIVNLNGQGADELMGGYSKPPHALRYLDSLLSGRLVDAHQQLFRGIRNSNQKIPGSLRTLLTDTAKLASRNMLYRSLPNSRKAMLNSEFFAQAANQSSYVDIFNGHPPFSSLQKRHSYHELKSSHLPTLLHNVDRDSMAHSLEARVPFLDYRIAEHIYSLPPSMLMNNGYTKYIYRRAMVGRIDNEVLWNNNKKGFATPVNNYLDLGQDYFTELLNTNTAHPVVDMEWAREAFANKRAQDSAQLWRTLGYLIWDRQRTSAD